jgi:hypothetical protein
MPNVNTFYESIARMAGKKRSMYFSQEVLNSSHQTGKCRRA